MRDATMNHENDANRDTRDAAARPSDGARGWRARSTTCGQLAASVALSLALVAVAATPAAAQRYDRPRVRFGVSGVGGGFVGSAHGALGGVAVRVGLQINDIVAVYVQGQGLIGQFLPGPGDDLAGFAFHSLMVDFTIADVFQVGAGPALDFVWGCDGRYHASCAGSGPYFGGDLRLAFLAGSPGPGRRQGLVFSFDAHPTWFGGQDAAITLLAGIGFELY